MLSNSKPRYGNVANQNGFGKVPAVACAGLTLFLFILYRALSGVPLCRYPDLNVATWNIAAINNNPFEYWITHDDDAYNKLMEDVQNFIEAPGTADVQVKDVFTNDMFNQLVLQMTKAGYDPTHISQTKQIWEDSFQYRKIVSEVLKDGELGKKRLMSMPDRVTNTIDAIEPTHTVYRPTVMNCYDNIFPEPQGHDYTGFFLLFVFVFFS